MEGQGRGEAQGVADQKKIQDCSTIHMQNLHVVQNFKRWQLPALKSKRSKLTVNIIITSSTKSLP
jgi:hypothetical protein